MRSARGPARERELEGLAEEGRAACRRRCRPAGRTISAVQARLELVHDAARGRRTRRSFASSLGRSRSLMRSICVIVLRISFYVTVKPFSRTSRNRRRSARGISLRSTAARRLLIAQSDGDAMAWRQDKSSRVTIRTVAEDAGVSVAAVSKVLRDAYGVSEALRAKVQASMQKLGYRPHAAARGMRGQTYTLGVLLPDMHNPFFADIMAGVNAALERTQYQPLLGVSQVGDDHRAWR